jgi:S1-C subfamily serine protease
MSQLVNPIEVLKSLSEATSNLVQQTSKSVVSINSRMSRGTGIVLTPEGYMITCNHVLQGCSTVKIGQGDRIYTARILATDPYNDIALLKAEHGEFQPADLGDSDKLNVGQFVIAIANPFNRNQPTATTGIITSLDSTLRGWQGTHMENIIATDAKLNPGFSGGPLADVNGKIIGINTAYVLQRGIAIPINKVKAIADRPMTGKTVKKGYLGVIANTVAIPQEVADETGIGQDTGVMIFSVESNSPARRAGLMMGDVIMKFNEKPVTNFCDLPRRLAEDVVGKETKLTILRGEKLLEAIIVPEAAIGENDE